MPLEVRAAAAPAVRAYLAFQDSQIILLQEQVASLQGDMRKLRLQLVDALARAHQHSGNSSRPPSSDPPSTPPRPKKAPSIRKRGGQNGHPWHTRLQLSAENLSGVVAYRPTQCPSCSLPLSEDLPTEVEPERVQVWEIAPITPQVTEHRGYRVRCPHCAVLVPAPDLPDGAFGPRLTAIDSVLHGCFRLSMRETTEMLGDLFGVPLGIGSVATLCQDVSAALSEPYAALRDQVETETHANVDETGWQEAGDKRWLWVAQGLFRRRQHQRQRVCGQNPHGESCWQQNRHLWTYLTTAVVAYRDGHPAPSLLPV